MKILSLFLVFVFVLSSTVSAQEKKNPLEGTTWELTSAKNSREDTTWTFPNSQHDRCIMIFGKTHFSQVQQDTSRDDWGFVSGTYTIDGENLTITLEMWPNYEDIGKTYNWKFPIEGNQGILKGTDSRFGGYDWKEVYQVYKRID